MTLLGQFRAEVSFMHFHVITLFPECFPGPLGKSILGKALEKEKLYLNIVNPRDFTTDRHKTCDDCPYGGGPGMVLKPEPIFKAVESITGNLSPAERNHTKIVLLSAKGKSYTQAKARHWSKLDHLILICGHYEGVDERVNEYLADEEIRVGNYILTGGELPAMIVIDSVARLLEDVIGSSESLQEESFSQGLKREYPQYTRPENFRDLKVPDVLLSGNHRTIATWRKKHMQ